MIELEHTLLVHEILIENFGGTKGVKDLKSLESALSRPFSTFGQSNKQHWAPFEFRELIYLIFLQMLLNITQVQAQGIDRNLNLFDQQGKGKYQQ